MKHTIEITTGEGLMLRAAIRHYINEPITHPIDREVLERVSDRIKRDILSNMKPTEPFEVEIPNSFGDKILICPECGEYIPWYANFCSICGQAVKKEGQDDGYQ